jgi:hypothetical protein
VRGWKRISIRDIEITFCDNPTITEIYASFIEIDPFNNLEFLGNKLYKVRYETFDHPLVAVPFITFASDIEKSAADGSVIVKFLGLISDESEGYFLSTVGMGAASIRP